jgi:hypothetical protein
VLLRALLLLFATDIYCCASAACIAVLPVEMTASLQVQLLLCSYLLYYCYLLLAFTAALLLLY